LNWTPKHDRSHTSNDIESAKVSAPTTANANGWRAGVVFILFYLFFFLEQTLHLKRRFPYEIIYLCFLSLSTQTRTDLFVVRQEGRLFASLPRWCCLLAFLGYGVFVSSMMCIMGGSILPAIWAVELASPSPLWTLEFCVGICCFSLSSLL